jgi:O-antigen ligase
VKEAVFLTLVFVGVPLVTLLLRVLPMGHRLGLAGLVASTAFIVDVNLFKDLAYRGMTRALTIATTDVMLWGCLFFLLLMKGRRGDALFAPREPERYSPIVWWPALSTAFFAFILLNTLALIGADELLLGFFDVLKLMTGALMFWVAANLVVDDPAADALPRFLAIFVGIEVVFAAKGFLQGMYFIQGTFEHKNLFAFSMNAVLPFLLARALLRPNGRLLYLALYGAGAVCVVLSRSRTGWMTLLLGAVIVITLALLAAARFGRSADVKRIGVIVAGMGVVGLIALAKLADGILARWSENEVASSEFRAVHLKVALDIIAHNPFGVGPDNYVAEIHKPIGDAVDDIDKIAIHNIYLLIAAEGGILALVAFLALQLSFGVIAVRLYRKARTMRGLYVAAGGIAALTGAMLHGLMESHGFLDRHSYLIWCLLLGLVVGVGQREGIRRVSLIRWLLVRRDQRLGLRRPAARTRLRPKPAVDVGLR